MKKPVLIVGAGLTGAVVARGLLNRGFTCHVIDKRPHVGGNCHTVYRSEYECDQHMYGPHIFHTDNQRIWEFVNRFATFYPFINRAKAVNGGIYSFPINLLTLQQLFGVCTPEEAAKFIDKVRLRIDCPANLEEWCLSKMGEELYDKFYRHYTGKQWGCDPRVLPYSIAQRIPIRYNFNDNYFTDRYQGIPEHGYTEMITSMLEGALIHLNVDFTEHKEQLLKDFQYIVYTGRIDEFYGYDLGMLEYRSLNFETVEQDCNDFQGAAIVNYTSKVCAHTRIIEHRHFSPDKVSLRLLKTLVTTETPIPYDPWLKSIEPYYPVRTMKNTILYDTYKLRADKINSKVIFCGRLGSYQYLNMDKAIEYALDIAAYVQWDQ